MMRGAIQLIIRVVMFNFKIIFKKCPKKSMYGFKMIKNDIQKCVKNCIIKYSFKITIHFYTLNRNYTRFYCASA